MAFATYLDVEARWRTLTPDEQTRVTVLLDDAFAELSKQVAVDESDALQAELLKIVSCNMVIRAMVAGESNAYGIDQMQATMGPFAQTVHYSNATGDLYLTKNEKRLLGIVGSGKGRILNPAVGGDLLDRLPDAL